MKILIDGQIGNPNKKFNLYNLKKKPGNPN
jgi:hypothetical protein